MNTLIPQQLTELALVGPMGPDIVHPLSILPQIAVDGGEEYAHAPFLWIGDGDSLNKKPQTAQVVELNPKKNISDLGHAFSLLSHHQVEKIHLWGFLGGRKDHELFNLGEGALFLKSRQQTELHYYIDKLSPEISYYSKGEWSFEFNSEFSLGLIDPCHIAVLGEIDYPINRPTYISPLSSFGLSNRANGRFFIEASGPFFLIRVN